ncbi:MAG: hypothetical protein WCT33_04615 [Patescibacteria group bacterium]|jgi:hypothetical protein
MEGSVSGHPHFEGELYAREVVERSASIDRHGELPCGCHHIFIPDPDGDHEPEFNPEAELAVINARIAELARS